MRLLRLQTDDDNCIFDNTLNTDLVIQPNSKIARIFKSREERGCLAKAVSGQYIYTARGYAKR